MQCGAGSCPAGATFHTFYASVRVSDPTVPGIAPNGGGLVASGWRRGEHGVGYGAWDNSGISRVDLHIDGVPKGSHAWPCDYTRTVPCVSRSGTLGFKTAEVRDGWHALRLTATDAAGNRRAYDRLFGTDNTPPGRVRLALAGGEGWRRSNSFSVAWDNPPQAYAPIVRARYRMCSAGGSCVDGIRTGRNIERLDNVPVPRLGDNTLDVWLEDEAGNRSRAFASDPVHLRLDPEAPRLAFLPQDASDPLAVAVRVTDGYSGVAGGEIEMRERGHRTWHELPTRLEGRRLLADIDDERLGSGTYDFRARAVDRAGNERSTSTRTDGGRAAVRLPVRITTGLRAGFLKTKTVRRVIRRKGRRRVVRRKVQVLDSTGRLRFGARGLIRGRLANPDGQPIDGAPITAFAIPETGGDPQTVGLVRTDAQGRFSYAIKATGNRLLRFRYRRQPPDPGLDGRRAARRACLDLDHGEPAPTAQRPDGCIRGQSAKRPSPAGGEVD